MININVIDTPVLPVSVVDAPTMPVQVELVPPLGVNLKDTVIEIVPAYDTYNGEYNVIPQAHSQSVLQTQGKVMKRNVTVQKVPYYETSNQYGDTVYIAEVTNG